MGGDTHSVSVLFEQYTTETFLAINSQAPLYRVARSLSRDGPRPS